MWRVWSWIESRLIAWTKARSLEVAHFEAVISNVCAVVIATGDPVVSSSSLKMDVLSIF